MLFISFAGDFGDQLESSIAQLVNLQGTRSECTQDTHYNKITGNRTLIASFSLVNLYLLVTSDSLCDESVDLRAPSVQN